MAQVAPFAVALVVTAAFSLVFAVLAWNRRGEPGALPLVAFHVAITVGTAAYAAEIVVTDLSTQITFLKLWLFAQALVPPTWLYAAIEYSGRARWATRRTAGLLAVEPLALGVVLSVPSFRAYFVTFPEQGVAGSLTPAHVDLGVLLTVHLVYLFLLAFAGSALLVQLFVRSRHMYRTQAAAVLVAAIAPFTTVLAQGLGLAPETDPSALTWALSGMALTAGLYRFKTLDPVPAAHSAIVEDMGDGALVLNEDGIVSDVNPAGRRHLTGNGDDIVGRHVESVIEEWASVPHVSDTGIDQDATAAASGPDEMRAGAEIAESDGGTATWHEVSMPVGDGTRHLELQASPFTDRFERHVGSLVVVRDVTERKEREQTLARYKTVFETTDDLVYVLDGDDRFIMVNQSFADFLGRDRADLIGERFEQTLAPGSALPFGVGRPGDAEAETAVDETAATEITIETAAGETVPCETRRTPIEFEDVSGSVGYLRDVSRRKQVEADLRETSGTLESLVDASPLAVVAVDRDGNIEAWNPAAEEIFGYSPEEVRGDVAPIIPDDQRERAQEIHQRVVAGEAVTDLEMPLERADGSTIQASVSIAPQRDADGEIHGTVSVIADVTDRRERERELERANERLEEFASVVSHDLRNPLQVAEANLEHVMATEDVDRAEDALDALHRMETLIEDVLTMARQGQDISDTETLELGGVVDAAWRHVDTADATLVFGPLPPVEGDPSRLQELFGNLFRNAVEHAGEDATVAVGALPDERGFFVADDGPGLSADEGQQLFEPGVTTAEDGTGFGLAIVERIVEAHDWSISVTPDGPPADTLPAEGPDALDGACFEILTGKS